MRAALSIAALVFFSLPSLQYPLWNDGTLGAPRADVDAPSAWEITAGDRAVIVAVVDTGVDVAHPELAASIWTNPGEIPGNGIDDDGDGLIDDVHGWDFADGDSDVLDEPFLGMAHGTLVAGLVAGTKTGLAPGVTVMPIKVFSSLGPDSNFENVAAAGIEYALAHGAKVIQISWELTGPPGTTLDTAFADAEAQGALVVVAAGNDGVNLDLTPKYPVSQPNANVVGVAGTDRYDRPVNLAGLFVTNFGPAWLELAAPTEQNPTTYPQGGDVIFTGTSAAAPLVSAAAALAWSANPALTAQQVRQALIDGADRLPQLEGICLGAGRLNAGNTVRLAAGAAALPPTAIAGPVSNGAPDEALLFDGRASHSNPAPGAAPLDAKWNLGDGATAVAPFAEHRYTTGGDWAATLEVTDPFGLSHVARTTVSIPFRGTPLATSIESAHPYAPGTFLVLPISAPGAAWIRPHFSKIETAGTDAVIVFDGAWTGLYSYQGSFTDFTMPPIRGDSAHVYLRGFAGGASGFTIDRVDVEQFGEANHPPIARADGTLSVVAGETATVSAAGSTDGDGDPMTFSWRLVAAPEGSTATASSTSGAEITFAPDVDGDFDFALTADDGLATGSTWVRIVRRASYAPGCQCDLKSVPGFGPGSAPGRFSATAILATLAFLVHRRRRVVICADTKGNP